MCKSATVIVLDAAAFCKAQTGDLNEDMIETVTLAFFWILVVAFIFAIPLRGDTVCDLLSWLGVWRRQGTSQTPTWSLLTVSDPSWFVAHGLNM